MSAALPSTGGTGRPTEAVPTGGAADASRERGGSSLDLTPADAPLHALLSGTDVGLALYDSSFKLVARNDAYMQLCALNPQTAPVGVTLMDLIRTALRGNRMNESEIEGHLDAVMRQLRPGATFRINHTRLDGTTIEVTRTCLVNGSTVETVREADGAATDMEGKLSEVVRSRLDQALNAMSDGFVLWDSDDRLCLYNRRFLEIYPGVADLVRPGVTFREFKRRMIGRGLIDTGGLEPEDFLEELIANHHSGGARWESRLADGRWILAQEKATQNGGIVGTRTDITALKERELALEEAAQRIDSQAIHFNTALENMNQGLCMFDAENRLIVANRRYLEMYGFSSSVVKPGVNLRDILEYSVSLGNYTAEQAERALAEREAKKTITERVTIKQRLADGRVIAVTNEPMKDGGSIATYQDISDLEAHEAELRAYNAKLEASNRELQDFAYVASHDLQEPLRKIETFGDRLAQKHAAELTGNGPVYIEKMQDAASRMRRLINDLLSYSRVTTKARPFQPVDLEEVLDHVRSDLAVRIEEQNAELVIGEMPTIDAERTQIRQVFQNLIANALKFVRPDTVPRVEVTCEIEGGHAVFRIADNGIGFENEFKEQIFTIFQRLHGRLDYEGTGIGLATVRKIIERHGGEIDAEGRPNEGATFTVRLPRVQAEA